MKNAKEENSVTFKMKMITKKSERVIGRIMRDVGLTHVQSFVLGFIHDNRDKDICQRDIEHFFNITHPTVIGILKRLEEKGYITCVPSESDKRYKIIRETKEAEALHMSIESAIDKAESEIVACLTDDEKDALMSALNKILDNIYPSDAIDAPNTKMNFKERKSHDKNTGKIDKRI